MPEDAVALPAATVTTLWRN